MNVTDGMLGQTSNTLFLITTNEPVSSFHEAVSRPGRCAALVEFLPLSSKEASAWLQEQGSDERVTGPTTLADLYGLVAGTPMPQQPHGPVGFAPPEGVR